MENRIKTGKEIIDDFFQTISSIPNVDTMICTMLKELYEQNKLTDTNIKNKLESMRNTNVGKN